MRSYFQRVSAARMVLWSYLIWYLWVLVLHFDPSPALWINSLGISAIIGTGLYLSTAHAGAIATRLDRWQVFRLYLMPFCVSSMAALIKDRGFFLVFHPKLGDNIRGIAIVGAFWAFAVVIRRSATRADKLKARANLAGS